MIQLSEVRAIKALPDRVEIHTAGPGTYVIHHGAQRVNILARGVRRPRGRRALATFLYFPEGEGATALVEQRAGHCTVVIREAPSTAGSLA